MRHVRYIIASGLWALILALLLSEGLQWFLGVFDYHPQNYWFQGLFVVLMILIWSPWKKLNLPPTNSGNNDIFPE